MCELNSGCIYIHTQKKLNLSKLNMVGKSKKNQNILIYYVYDNCRTFFSQNLRYMNMKSAIIYIHI